MNQNNTSIIILFVPKVFQGVEQKSLLTVNVIHYVVESVFHDYLLKAEVAFDPLGLLLNKSLQLNSKGRRISRIIFLRVISSHFHQSLSTFSLLIFKCSNPGSEKSFSTRVVVNFSLASEKILLFWQMSLARSPDDWLTSNSNLILLLVARCLKMFNIYLSSSCF